MATPSSPDDSTLVREFCDGMDAYIQDPSEANRARMCLAEQEIIRRHYSFLNVFAAGMKNRRTPPAEDMVQQFLELLLQGDILCGFEGRRGASLKTYLLGIFKNRILDEMRKKYRKPEECSLDHLSPDEQSGIEDRSRGSNPENGLVALELSETCRRVIRGGLLTLSRDFPHDSRLMELKMRGVSNSEIIEKNLLEVNIRESALKKRFERAKERYGIILKRRLKKEGLSFQDLVGHFSEQ